MTKEEIQQMKDKAFQTKNKEQWDAVMQEIKKAVEGDETAATTLRNYCKAVLPKKNEYWAKYGTKKPYNTIPKLMFSKETDDAIRALADTMRQYYANLIDIQYMTYWEKKDE